MLIKKLLPGATLTGAPMRTSNSLSIFTIAGCGSLKTNKGNAKLTVMFLKYPYLYYFKLGCKKYFII